MLPAEGKARSRRQSLPADAGGVPLAVVVSDPPLLAVAGVSVLPAREATFPLPAGAAPLRDGRVHLVSAATVAAVLPSAGGGLPDGPVHPGQPPCASARGCGRRREWQR